MHHISQRLPKHSANKMGKNGRSEARAPGLYADTIELLSAKYVSCDVNYPQIEGKLSAEALAIPISVLTKLFAPFGSSTAKDFAPVSGFHAPTKSVNALTFQMSRCL